MIHHIGFRTEIGRSHRVNQDAGGAWSVIRSDGTPATLLVVADGVSSGRRSEEASRLVVQTLHAELAGPLQCATEDVDALLARLVSAVLDANHQVARRPHQSAGSADATTVTALVCIGEEAAGLWCGDSRIYKIGESVVRLTRDHSWAEGVVSHGLMTSEQAARDPRAHMITRWIGPPDGDDPGLETLRARVQPHDIILCCSDGLFMYFAAPFGQEGELAQMRSTNSLQDTVDGLVSIASTRGGHDDITAAALRAVAG